MIIEIDGARKNLKKSLRRSRRVSCKKSNRTKSRRSKRTKSRRTKRTKSRRTKRTKSKRSKRSKRTKSRRTKRTKSVKKCRRSKSVKSRRTKSRKCRRTKSRSKKSRASRNNKVLNTCIEYGLASQKCQKSLNQVTVKARKSIRKILRSFQIPSAKNNLKTAKDIIRQQIAERQKLAAQRLKKDSILGSIIVSSGDEPQSVLGSIIVSSSEEPMPITSTILNIADIIVENPDVKSAVADALNVKSAEIPLLSDKNTAISIAQNLPRETILAIEDSPDKAADIIGNALFDVKNDILRTQIKTPREKLFEEIKEDILRPGPKISFDDISNITNLIQKSVVVKNAVASSLELSGNEILLLEDDKSARTIAETLPESVVVDVLNSSSEAEKALIIENALEGSKGTEVAEVVTVANVIDNTPGLDSRLADVLNLPMGGHDDINKTDVIKIIADNIPEDALMSMESAPTLGEKIDILMREVSMSSDNIKNDIETFKEKEEEIKEEMKEEIKSQDQVLNELINKLTNYMFQQWVERELVYDSIEMKIHEIKTLLDIERENKNFIELCEFYLMVAERRFNLPKLKPSTILKIVKKIPKDIIDNMNNPDDDSSIINKLKEFNNRPEIQQIINESVVKEEIANSEILQQTILDVAKLSDAEITNAETIISNPVTIDKIIDNLPDKVVKDFSEAATIPEKIEILNKAVDTTPAIVENIKKALRECKCDDLLFDILKAYPNNVLREISEIQFIYYSKLAADRNVDICSGGKSYRECFYEYGFKITNEPKEPFKLPADFQNKLTQALRRNKTELVGMADEEDKKIVSKAIDSAKPEDLSTIAVQLLMLEDIKPSSTVEDIFKAIENNSSKISDNLLIPADIFMSDASPEIKEVAADVINNKELQEVILENLNFTPEEEKQAAYALLNASILINMFAALPDYKVAEIADATDIEEQKKLLGDAIVEDRATATNILRECQCDEVVLDILEAFPEKVVSEKFVTEYYQKATKKFTNCIIKSYDSYVDCLRSKDVKILLEGDEIIKLKPNEISFYPQGEFKKAFDYFIAYPEINLEEFMKRTKFPAQIKTESDKLVYLMREHRAVSNYTKGYKVLEYITSENIDLEDYKKYLAKNDSEFKYVLGEFELPYYIALYDFNIQSELLPRAKNFFAKREVYDRYLNKYKYTPEFQWIILNPNINDKGKDNQILVLLYKKHLDNVRKSFKPTYKKKQAEIKAQKIQKIAKRFREIPEEENILSRQRDIEFNKQIREKTEALKRGLPAKNVSLDIDSVAEKFRAVPEKTNIARETKEEKEKEEKFYQAYDYFKKIAYSMLSPAEEKYNFWGTTQYAVLDKPSEELVEEQVQNIVDYLENYYKDTNLLKQTDIKDRAISAYNKFKDLIPPQSVITDSDLDRAERYFEERGAGFLWSTSKEQIFKELLNNYLNNPFIIAINTGIRDPETRNRHLKYAVYKLAKNELF